jgi:hypothetical protein
MAPHIAGAEARPKHRAERKGPARPGLSISRIAAERLGAPQIAENKHNHDNDTDHIEDAVHY